jgi:alpha-amylase
MPSICFYFQVHQPYRLRNYSYFDSGTDHHYFDVDKNRAILRKVSEKCYLPTNKLILELIRRYQGAFKVSYSITGVAIEQMQEYMPEVLDSFIELSETGCVEFISETYYHSLSALYNIDEFKAQVKMHTDLMQKHFKQTPQIFRNTELIYDDAIGKLVSSLGYKAMIAEGVDDVLGWRSPDFVYTTPGTDLKLLLKNYRLSDDIAFRFSNRSWKEFPLTADKFANWVHAISGNGETVNLFMDYETFGEHQWESTGIFNFLNHLPEYILKHSDWGFSTPSEVIQLYESVADIHFHRLTSWADVDRDLTAWRGNEIQNLSFHQIYELAEAVDWTQKLVNADVSHDKERDDLDIWRKLQTSDHFYYMCTKWFADGDVHAYFSPYSSPYEAFINYMNVIKDFRGYLLEKTKVHGIKRVSYVVPERPGIQDIIPSSQHQHESIDKSYQ